MNIPSSWASSSDCSLDMHSLSAVRGALRDRRPPPARNCQELVVQRCQHCGTHQFFVRPFCLARDVADLEWVPASGLDTIDSMTTARRQASPDHPVPYVNALVEVEGSHAFAAPARSGGGLTMPDQGEP